jgi:hypothetical protein
MNATIRLPITTALVLGALIAAPAARTYGGGSVRSTNHVCGPDQESFFSVSDSLTAAAFETEELETGEFTANPLPTALPLFGTGPQRLRSGWRRKWKARALAQSTHREHKGPPIWPTSSPFCARTRQQHVDAQNMV